MLEELQRRNYSEGTTRAYLHAVEQFARHFGKSPDKLGPDDLRSYQAYLLVERKLAVGSVVARVAALRFFFVRTLKRRDFREELPYPKSHRRLPTVLSLEEVARLIDAAGNLMQRALLMTLYGTGMRRTEVSMLKVRDNPRHPFFLPVKVLSRVFRGKFLDFLQRVPRQQLPGLDSTLMRNLLREDWVVYAKPAFGQPERVLRYLGRYTHRVAISNQRLLSFDGHNVTFRWRDYAHGNKQRIMTLTATEFLRRFCQHVLPRGFVRIRHFGYLASAHRTALLALARLHLKSPSQPDSPIASSQVATWRCPRCGANMHIGPYLTSQQLTFRCRLPDSS
jgi:Putative transposase/Phage integrase, N-terminal SAM-like domain